MGCLNSNFQKPMRNQGRTPCINMKLLCQCSFK